MVFGVSQGSELSTLLYLQYTSDLQLFSRELFLCYAERADKASAVSSHNLCLTRLVIDANAGGIVLNPIKTKALVISE